MKQIDNSLLKPLIKPGTRRLLNSLTRSDTITLEVGCGPGQYRLATNGLFFGVDITADDYRQDLPRNFDALADARFLPFKSASFDLIFFSNFFHVFENDVSILSDCLRLTKPGGCILIVDYSYPTLKYLRDTYATTSPGFTAYPHKSKDWLEMLKSAGYKNPDIRINSTSLSSRLLKRLLPGKFFNQYLDSRDLSLAIIGEK
ncbi:MAG TPA: class I SAM-dependent methyltransferase [Leptolinea sp.]